jgi:hypothetical protein
MDLDRGQYTEYAECIYCKGTGDFQERRKRARRSTDEGAVSRERIEAVLGTVPYMYDVSAAAVDYLRAVLIDGSDI